MVAVSTALALGLGAASVGFGYASYKQQKKQAAFAQEAAGYQKKQSDLSAARQRRDAVRASRQAYASAQTNAANQGSTATSGSLGGLGSILSQGASNVSFLDRFNTLSDQAGVALGNAAEAEGKASMFNFASGLAMQGASFAAAHPSQAQVKNIPATAAKSAASGFAGGFVGSLANGVATGG